jgi:hypothetical protein
VAILLKKIAFDLVFSGEIVRWEISREDTQVELADKIGNL